MVLSIQFGTIIKDSLTGVKMMSAVASSTNYDTFALPVGTKYQVPAGKIYHAGQVRYSGDTVGMYIDVGYGDTSVTNSAVPPTNYVNLLPFLAVDTAVKHFTENIYLYIPANKYPCIRSVAGIGTTHIIGFEE